MRMIKSLIKYILKKLPKKYILLASEPDYCDNTGAVYDYIINNNLDKKLKAIWVVNNPKNVDKSKKTIVNDGKFINTLKYLYYGYRCNTIVYCNQIIEKFFSEQISVYLTHGSIAKNIVGKCKMPSNLDYTLIQSDFFEEIAYKNYELTDYTKMVKLGFPRNDDLLIENHFNLKSMFNIEFEKIIVWYPTFRQHKRNKNRNVSTHTLPIIYNEDEARIINEFAKSNKVLIVLKPHFGQDTTYIKDLKLSNIVIINDNFLEDNNIRSYQFLSLSDALITDYSSVYYDYILTDKPIGLTWDDYDEYAEREGFCVDTDKIFAGGEKIYNSDDFCNFVKNVADGNDILREERNKVKDLTNYYQDANSSKRVAEYILNLAENNIN